MSSDYSESNNIYKSLSDFVIKTINKKEDINNLVRFTTLDDISNNDWKLDPELYVDYLYKFHKKVLVSKSDQFNYLNLKRIEELSEEIENLIIKFYDVSSHTFNISRAIIKS